MTIKIQEVEASLNREELDFFIKGSISLEKSVRRKPYDWIPEQGWEDMVKLMDVNSEVFGSLADDVEKNERTWREVSGTHMYCLKTTLPLIFPLPPSLFLPPFPSLPPSPHPFLLLLSSVV